MKQFFKICFVFILLSCLCITSIPLKFVHAASLPPGQDEPLPPGGNNPLPPGQDECTGVLGCVLNPLPNIPSVAGSGLIFLLSNLLRLVFVIAGIYAFIRIVLGGLKFMSAGGDPKAIQQAWESIYQSLLGLAIVICSVVLAAFMGQIFFGDPLAILSPKIFGPVVTP